MSRKFPPLFELHIKRLAPGGEGVSPFQSRLLRVYGVLPGERVRVSPIRAERGGGLAKLEEVLEPHPLRRPARDGHFTSCAPWQIVPEELQRDWKRDFVLGHFREAAGETPLPAVEVAWAEPLWSYRGKMEFSFCDADGVSLAFHERGRFSKFAPLTECALAHERINRVGAEVVRECLQRGIPPESLKYLTIRASSSSEEVAAALTVKVPDFPVFPLASPGLTGWTIAFSNPLTPAACETELLLREGTQTLHEELLGRRFTLSPASFFQIHPRAFATLLEWVLAEMPAGESLLELYSGVGTIGIVLSPHFREVLAVESDADAVRFARENVAANGAGNVRVVAGFAEAQDLVPLLRRTDVLIVDPPRAGLHPKVTRAIIEDGPRWFWYISCNPVTQARDYAILQRNYVTRRWRLFDLYPQTPLVESVLLLERRGEGPGQT